MKIIGLTGTIGSGKSTVSEYIKRRGYSVIDADQVAKELTRPGREGYQKIRSLFGDEFLDEGREIDRKKLGKFVFADKKRVELLNRTLHPMILSVIAAEIKDHEKTGEKIIFLDAPLLIESGMKDLVDQIILITTEKEKLLQRIIRRDKISEEQARAIMEHQMNVEEKREFADVVIDNDGDLDSLYRRIEMFLEIIERS